MFWIKRNKPGDFANGNSSVKINGVRKHKADHLAQLAKQIQVAEVFNFRYADIKHKVSFSLHLLDQIKVVKY